MFIKFVDIDWFLCNSYPCVLFESLWHVINQESHVYSWNLGKIYLVHFLKFWYLPRFTREISKFQKSEFGKFIPNFPLKHVITSTNTKDITNYFRPSDWDKLDGPAMNSRTPGASETSILSAEREREKWTI